MGTWCTEGVKRTKLEYQRIESTKRRRITIAHQAERIEQLQAEFIRLNIIIDNRAEDLEIKAKYEQLQAEKETLKDRQRNAEIGLAEVSALNEKLQAELEKCRWIPVTERLPTKKDNGYITGCNIETLLVGNMFWSNTNADAKYLTARYTHWKSTILPPKEKPE